tara:strand:- start:6517 stop:7077 length:561 start_codon:yes stop_codon:yes gene_type:complete
MTITDEARAVAREYIMWRMCECEWGLHRILDESTIAHASQLTERDAIDLVAAHWQRYIKPGSSGTVTPAPSKPAAVGEVVDFKTEDPLDHVIRTAVMGAAKSYRSAHAGERVDEPHFVGSLAKRVLGELLSVTGRERLQKALEASESNAPQPVPDTPVYAPSTDLAAKELRPAEKGLRVIGGRVWR